MRQAHAHSDDARRHYLSEMHVFPGTYGPPTQRALAADTTNQRDRVDESRGTNTPSAAMRTVEGRILDPFFCVYGIK